MARRRLSFALGLVVSGAVCGCALTNPKPPLPNATHLPALVDPPPAVSQVGLPEGLLIDARTLRLGQIMRRIEDRLQAAGIDEWTVYAHGDGFAVVTRLEHIDDEGRAQDRRFPALHPRLEASGFQPDDYPQLLFNSSTGSYRFFVLLVQSERDDATPTTTVPIDGDELLDGELPDELGELPVRNHSCEVLVYEIERGADHSQPARYERVTSLSASRHLVSAGIFTEAELAP